MKTVGIIGGLGPETTAEFYQEIVFSSFSRSKIKRPAILIWNVPLPYKIETRFLLTGRGEKRYLPYLLDAAKRLEKGGADFLVIPCNSVHIFILEIRKAVRIPVLSIIEETVAYVREHHWRHVGLLASSATREHHMYSDPLMRSGIAVTEPNHLEQERIGRTIRNLVQKRYANKDRDILLSIIRSFRKKKVNKVLLACTDLQLLVPKEPGIAVIDTMHILAKATVREIFSFKARKSNLQN